MRAPLFRQLSFSRQAMEIQEGAGTRFSQSTHRPGRSRFPFGEAVASMYPPVKMASTVGRPSRTRILATTVMLGTGAIGSGATISPPSTIWLTHASGSSGGVHQATIRSYGARSGNPAVPSAV
nr:hypothetical protein [Streptomyces antimycoticus]